MERRALRLLDVIYANTIAREIQNLPREICCGCKTYEQDCFMMTEERWDMHGMTAIERVNAHHAVWHEFLDVLGILNIEQKDPDRSIFCLGLVTTTRKQSGLGEHSKRSITPSRATSVVVV